jgi:AraC family transcriptional regulator of adaptative response/methylated-DNA-[protein]-cysteine methyltransferase
MHSLPSPGVMWRALLDRDAAFDGAFLIGVRTTGIFCRPTCPARKPRRENVEFFPSVQQALLAGYRPCRRCRPMDAAGAAPEWAGGLLRLMERAPQRRIRDGDLRRMSIDPARARRYFKARYGMTFQAYQRSLRLGAALGHLRRGSDQARVAFHHGFASTSGFRAAFERLFGGTPGRARHADPLMVRWLDTPIGPFVAGATSRGVCLFEFADRRAIESQIGLLRRRIAAPAIPGTNAHLDRLAAEVAAYFAGSLRRFTVPLHLLGTPFQEEVWRALLQIPAGATRCYEDIAVAIGRPAAQRAVARANGQNRIAILVPCHRVIAKDGRLCGYGGGVWRKQYLLELERGGQRA